ncbi:MAG: VapC toxin family PIN domain ribonuclease [Spirochaetae bacterium HGW-Spirochaetae-1]|jgi:predicted nucleic-acid-binding protein|nr:MAG: VapC toxin family PIN domain ribonuclease [Spirochaetae bacterium HGW-Spirochaetae-1]
MKALDTNIIIRFLVNDDKKQGEAVKTLFLKTEKKGESFFITNTVLLETIYVLDSVYEYERKEILNALELMSMMKIIIFENPDVVHHLINSGRKSKTELEDLLIGIIAKEYGCESTITFDKKAAASKLFEMLY